MLEAEMDPEIKAVMLDRFVFVRRESNDGAYNSSCGSMMGPLYFCKVIFDWRAVSHLDAVRTDDLKQSHKNLEPARPTLGIIL
jgi:hypothetical protein